MWHKYFTVLTALWLANFLALIVLSAGLGGDAVSGHVENGHYFLASHGKLTEVSRGVFTFSAVHVMVTIVLSIVMLVSAVINIFVKKFHKPVGR